MEVNGKVALITGAAQGLGKGFAITLLDKGAKVLLTDINEEVGKETHEELQKKYGANNVDFCKADVTSEKDFADCFQKAKETFNRLDIVINNAGIGGEGDGAWEKVLDINLKASIRGTKMALNYLRKDKGGYGGVIMNIASAGGLIPQPAGPVYSASKSGLIMFSRSIAANPEFMANGVRMTVLCPAFVDTPLTAKLSQASTTSANRDLAMQKIQAVGIMSVEEVMGDFMELLTDDKNNGAVLCISKNKGKHYLTF